MLDLPVAHCSAAIYQVGDEVLIDFPERDWSAGPMAVWDSARVIGRAANTRVCATVSFSAQGYGIEWDNEDTETESITPVSGCNGYASSFNAATWTLNARADSPTIAYAGPATEHVCSQVGGEDPYETARVHRCLYAEYTENGVEKYRRFYGGETQLQALEDDASIVQESFNVPWQYAGTWSEYQELIYGAAFTVLSGSLPGSFTWELTNPSFFSNSVPKDASAVFTHKQSGDTITYAIVSSTTETQPNGYDKTFYTYRFDSASINGWNVEGTR